MNALVFLAGAVVLSLIGIAIVMLRNRQPQSLESGIDSFRQEMRALSPEEEERGRDRRGRPPGSSSPQPRASRSSGRGRL